MNIRIETPNFHEIIKNMISRPDYLRQLATAMKRSPVTSLLGPRQCGKTTLWPGRLAKAWQPPVLNAIASI
jgi:predicted AAA+ superfamily ATPase